MPVRQSPPRHCRHRPIVLNTIAGPMRSNRSRRMRIPAATGMACRKAAAQRRLRAALPAGGDGIPDRSVIASPAPSHHTTSAMSTASISVDAAATLSLCCQCVRGDCVPCRGRPAASRNSELQATLCSRDAETESSLWPTHSAATRSGPCGYAIASSCAGSVAASLSRTRNQSA
jgi:hypothetical protein